MAAGADDDLLHHGIACLGDMYDLALVSELEFDVHGVANPALAIIVPTTLEPGVANATLANAPAATPAIARDAMSRFTMTADLHA